jgi:hypothetical protein
MFECLGLWARSETANRDIGIITSVCQPVRLSARNNSATAGRTLVKSEMRRFEENLSRKLKFQNLDKNNRYGTAGTEQPVLDMKINILGIFFIITPSVLLRMRNVAGRICTENQNTRSLIRKNVFPKSCRL